MFQTLVNFSLLGPRDLQPWVEFLCDNKTIESVWNSQADSVEIRVSRCGVNKAVCLPCVVYEYVSSSSQYYILDLHNLTQGGSLR